MGWEVLIRTLHDPITWLIVGAVLVALELAIPNGYALALAAATAPLGLTVWLTGTPEELTKTDLWPLPVWACLSAIALYIVQRHFARRTGKDESYDVNQY